MKERGELPNVEGDVVRKCTATHEEDFWSSWLREDEKLKKEKLKLGVKGEEGERRKRQEEEEQNETETVKRRL